MTPSLTLEEIVRPRLRSVFDLYGFVLFAALAPVLVATAPDWRERLRPGRGEALLPRCLHDESLFLNDHGALFGLGDRVGGRLGLLPAVVVLRHAFAVVDVPHIVFLVDPDRQPALRRGYPSRWAGRKPTHRTSAWCPKETVPPA